MSVIQDHPRKVAAGGAAAAAAAIMLLSSPLIAPSEGLRTMPYRDPIGIWTECEGHTGKDVKPGHRNTLAECQVKFDADQTKAIKAIGACTKVAVPIESFAAFTSFSFNAGPAPYCKNFAPLINTGRLKAACDRLSVYVYAGHRKLAGLVSRRARERALCLRGVTS